MTAARTREYLVVLAGVAFCALLVAGRTISEARAELEVAREHEGAGAPLRAVEHYRRALRWSFPLSPYTAEAVSDLERIAGGLEAAGDVDGALLAWRSLAGGLGASRFLYSGADPSREHAKDEIARLLGEHGAAPTDARLTPARLAADHRRLLEREARADPFWGTVLLVGFLIWVLSLISMTRRGFDSNGELRWRDAKWPASGALVGIVFLVIGLLFA